ncbi:hypothetical protein Tco_0611904, partial [Tanacetum coccineum]
MSVTTAKKEDPSPSTKDTGLELHSNPKEAKKTTRRELFIEKQ